MSDKKFALPELEGKPTDFIREAIRQDLRANKWGGKIITRFPPEPNGYLHIGHAKSICLNFEVAKEFGGICHLRFDDTNPCHEEADYVEAIQNDIRWLGYDWEEKLFFASDYFEQLYAWAVELIKQGKAYVCDLDQEEIRAYRGTPTTPGKESPYRNRSVEENLSLFERMRQGKFYEGSRVLRAKIDMQSPNLNLRDPVMYRILHVPHHRTSEEWHIYPTYDFAHGQSDSIEKITHSLCTLEFQDHRPLYDFFLDALQVHHPRQIEFSRLNLTYTVLSKRKLNILVEQKIVQGWDDPRMPTLAGLRRRGYTPTSIQEFCRRIGVTKDQSTVQIEYLEHCLRDDLNKHAPRKMAVLEPLKVVLLNYPKGQTEWLLAINNPEDPKMGRRKVPFSRELYIEQQDFMEDPPKKFYRLAPGREVRLRYAYFIRCEKVIHDPATGKVQELHCTYDPATRGGDAPDGRKVKATLHWVSASHALPCEVRLYERLFTTEFPEAKSKEDAWLNFINPQSVQRLPHCFVELSLKTAVPGEQFQFERKGYFCVDLDSSEEHLVFNRTVTLRDSWAKIQKKSGPQTPSNSKKS